MGNEASNLQPQQLEGARLLAIAASLPPKGDFPCGLHVRLQLKADQREAVDIQSKDGLRCRYTTCDTNGDALDLLRELKSTERVLTYSWQISTARVAFKLMHKGEEATLSISSRTSLTAKLVSERVPSHWEPDTKRLSCALCRAFFGVLLRKHHCRACGRLVCAYCSEHSAIVSKVEPEPGWCSQNLSCGLCLVDSRDDASARVCYECYYGPEMIAPVPPKTPPSATSSVGAYQVSEGCYYDKGGHLHINLPCNRAALLLQYDTRPVWPSAEQLVDVFASNVPGVQCDAENSK